MYFASAGIAEPEGKPQFENDDLPQIPKILEYRGSAHPPVGHPRYQGPKATSLPVGYRTMTTTRPRRYGYRS